jgi:hypothetical protein
MQGDTARAVGGPREQGLREVAGAVLRGRESAFGRSPDRDRDRRESPIRQEPLLSRVLSVWRKPDGAPRVPPACGPGALVVGEAPLHIAVRCHPVQVAFALRAHDGFLADLRRGCSPQTRWSPGSPRPRPRRLDQWSAGIEHHHATMSLPWGHRRQHRAREPASRGFPVTPPRSPGRPSMHHSDGDSGLSRIGRAGTRAWGRAISSRPAC